MKDALLTNTTPSVVKRARQPVTANHLLSPSFMVETNGGGRLENVHGFNVVKAMSSGFRGGRVPPHLRKQHLVTASDFEFAVPQSTFGDDDRVLIQDTTQIPWRCVCQLVIDGLHGRQLLGTGWLAGPHTVITAGHNLYSHEYNHQATKVWVLPGRCGDVVPFGYDAATNFDVHRNWKDNGNHEYDIGVIWLDKPIGTNLGWFGYAACADTQLQNLLINNSGYPADKPLGTQWFNAGRLQSIKTRTLSYGLDTEPGQSGSPIFYYDAQMRRIVVAIHAYGNNSENIGIRITPDIYTTIAGWIK